MGPISTLGFWVNRGKEVVVKGTLASGLSWLRGRNLQPRLDLVGGCTPRQHLTASGPAPMGSQHLRETEAPCGNQPAAGALLAAGAGGRPARGFGAFPPTSGVTWTLGPHVNL